MSISGLRREAMVVAVALATLGGSAALAQSGTYDPYDYDAQGGQLQGQVDGQYGGQEVDSVDAFDDALAPYGTWENVSSYGRVWRPDPYYVGSDFQPYSTGGRWVYTDYGWYWQSDWSWGWATFHYGRWIFDPVLGWVWTPGTEWAPAWVQWRIGGGYVGWCPLGPTDYHWRHYGHRHYWNFVQTRNFQQPNPIHYAVPMRHFHHAMDVTQPVHRPMSYSHSHWSAGPDVHRISARTQHPIRAAAIRPPHPGHFQRAHFGQRSPFDGNDGFHHRPAPTASGPGFRSPHPASGFHPPPRAPRPMPARPGPSSPGAGFHGGFHPPAHSPRPIPPRPAPRSPGAGFHGGFHPPSHFGGGQGGFHPPAHAPRPMPSRPAPRPPGAGFHGGYHPPSHFGGGHGGYHPPSRSGGGHPRPSRPASHPSRPAPHVGGGGSHHSAPRGRPHGRR